MGANSEPGSEPVGVGACAEDACVLPTPEHGDEAMLRAALDSMFDPHVVLQAVRSPAGEIVDFRYAVANEAACAFNLKAPAELIGASLLDLHPAAATTELLEAYRTVIETGHPLILDDWAYPQDVLNGEERRYDVRAVKVGDDLSQTWRDVTDRYLTEQKLRAAVTEYRLLAENAADVVIRTRGGIALWVSPSVTEQLGWQPADIIGTDLTALVHPDDRTRIAQARLELTTGTISRLRYRVSRADGGWTWMQTDSRPWISDDGEVDGVVGALRNVEAEVAALEELRGAEAKLAAEHTRLEMVLTSIGLATWDWRVPLDAIGLDQGWAHLTGFPAAAGAPMTLRQWRALVHPDDREATDRVLHRSVQGDASVYDMEYRLRHREGRWIWIRERGHVVQRDDAGKALHVMGTMEGIDELKAAQEALSASEAHYRILAENASSMVSMADADGTLLWISPSVRKLLGWDPEELRGIDVARILHPDDLPAVRAGQARASEGVESSFEARARTPDDDYKWFEVTLRPTFDEVGRATGRVAGWRDIDAEHRTREELERSRVQLQYLASHDALTGLLNRREFADLAEAELAEGQPSLGLLFVDVDDFKEVNDTHGHAVGDEVIRAIAGRVAGCGNDVLAGRFGGDEFLVLVRGIQRAGQLAQVARRIEQACSQPVTLAATNLTTTVSIGGALSRPGDNLDTLMVRADSALYESKRAGRARSTIVGGEWSGP